MIHPRYAEARAAIERLNGDTTVHRDVTLEGLQELRADIDCYLMALDETDADEEGGD